MAETTITIPDLGSLTAGQVSDLLLVTRGTTGYKMLVSDIAKTIIETYAGSSLAGSSQSVKSALDSLNSSVIPQELMNTDLDTLTAAPMSYYAPGTHGNTNVPDNLSSFGMFVVKASAGYRAQIVISSEKNTNRVYIRIYGNNSWGAWKTVALNEDTNGVQKGTLPTNSDLDQIVTPGVYLLSGSNTYQNAPSSYGILEVIIVGNSTIKMQRVTTVSSMHTRYYSMGQWDAWAQYTVRS